MGPFWPCVSSQYARIALAQAKQYLFVHSGQVALGMQGVNVVIAELLREAPDQFLVERPRLLEAALLARSPYAKCSMGPR